MWFPIAPRPMKPIVLALSTLLAIEDFCENILKCEGLRVNTASGRRRGRECRDHRLHCVCRMVLEGRILQIKFEVEQDYER